MPKKLRTKAMGKNFLVLKWINPRIISPNSSGRGEAIIAAARKELNQ